MFMDLNAINQRDQTISTTLLKLILLYIIHTLSGSRQVLIQALDATHFCVMPSNQHGISI